MHPATSAPPVPPPAAPASPIADVAPAVAAAVAVLTLRIAALAGREGQHLLFDDAFISFRYAQNFANGLGLVFNEGERVEGYTNFLWTVLLAGAARLGLDIVSTSVVLAAVCTIATTIVLAAFGRVLFDREPHARLLIAIAPVLFAAWGSVGEKPRISLNSPRTRSTAGAIGFFLSSVRIDRGLGLMSSGEEDEDLGASDVLRIDMTPPTGQPTPDGREGQELAVRVSSAV